MSLPEFRRTYMSPREHPGMAICCTYWCPTKGCTSAAQGYAATQRDVFIGECPRGHRSVFDNRSN